MNEQKYKQFSRVLKWVSRCFNFRVFVSSREAFFGFNFRAFASSRETVFTVLLLPICALLLNGCSEKSPVPEDTSTVLATIGREAITERQLQVSLENLIGEAQTAQLDEQAKQNALEALVASRAIAKQALQSLSPDELLNIELKTRLYREKLLLGEYLKQHAQPEPVTDEMVKAYYDTHLQEYGGGVERHYEMIQVADKLTGDTRGKLIEKLGDASRAENWRSVVDSMNKQGLPVVYRRGVVNEAVLDAKLVNLANSTPEGKTSDVVLVDGKPLIIRVTSETQKTARSLHEVSADIRKKLLPQQLKEAIKAVQEQVLEEAEVEYTGKPNE